MVWLHHSNVLMANHPNVFPTCNFQADLYAGIERTDGAVNDDLFIGKSVNYALTFKMERYTQGPLVIKASVAGGRFICYLTGNILIYGN